MLPVFASVDAMSRWNPAARPVPADGVRVALAAADDGTDLVVLDPGSETEFVLRRPAVWAVAQSQPWHPPFDSADVRAAFERSIGTELAVLGVELDAGDPEARLAGPELVVRLSLVAGLTRAELDAVLQRLAARWAADDAIATLVDSLTVRLDLDLTTAHPVSYIAGYGGWGFDATGGRADQGGCPRAERMPLAPPTMGTIGPPPPPRPVMSDQTKPPVLRKIPVPKVVKVARTLWLLSFVLSGAACSSRSSRARR